MERYNGGLFMFLLLFIISTNFYKMNFSGPQPNKQSIDCIEKGIARVAAYKADRPTDLFQFYHPQIRKHFVDAYNLCRIWVQGLLYWKGIYPQQAFQLKTAYSRKIYVVKSIILRQYLDKFFQSLCQNFQFIDFLEVQLYQHDEHDNPKIVQSERFRFSFSQKYVGYEIQEIKKRSLNSIQKQIQFKRFLGKMQQQLNKGYYRPLNKKATYQLQMGYKWDHKNKHNKHRLNLLNRWTEAEEKDVDRSTINHTGTGQFEVICERYTFKQPSSSIESQ